MLCYKTHFKRLQIVCQSEESKQTNGWRREGRKEGRYEQMTPTVNRCGSTAEATQRLFTLQDISLLHYNRMAASHV